MRFIDKLVWACAKKSLEDICNMSSSGRGNVFSIADKSVHYTSAESFVNIIKASSYDCAKIILWASHMKFLNDAEEFSDGIKTIREEAEFGKFQSESDLFVVCFHEDDDLLSQWKYYGKESGLAVEFDLKNCDYTLSSTVKTSSINLRLEIPSYRVIYDRAKKKKVIKNIKNYCARKDEVFDIHTELSYIVPYFKNDGFKEENENRLVFHPLEIVSGSGKKRYKTKISYRFDRNKIKPYVEVLVQIKDNSCLTIKERGPIKSITIGPGYNQQVIFEALIHMLDVESETLQRTLSIGIEATEHTTVRGIVIRKSAIPFRD